MRLKNKSKIILMLAVYEEKGHRYDASYEKVLKSNKNRDLVFWIWKQK